MDGQAMLAHVQDGFSLIKDDLGSKGDLFAAAMKDAVFIVPNGRLMVEMVNTIDAIYALIAKEEKGQSFHDVQGDIYEEFLSEIASAEKNGQFRTPRHIIQMMATMLNPQLGDTVCTLRWNSGFPSRRLPAGLGRQHHLNTSALTVLASRTAREGTRSPTINTGTFFETIPSTALTSTPRWCESVS